ncbi:redox-regulated ATPase YchF [Pasteuria penetrans]|uniref:redox-regulated ATPase YchF n=1 Tax=Pasteuria penetrans TaxID=86005 RepID=UPI000F9A3E3A|nr:redox-regulated ATPase YchF [Pasteuria penetrans]
MSVWAAGMIGLPNVGKSTLFNAVTRAGAAAANYPFCTIEPNVGTVPVPDPRLDALARSIQPRSVVPTVVQFVDIAGIVKGASRGEGLGNAFLGHIRTVDTVVQVVRCFTDDSVIHVSGKVDPVEDVRTIELELVLADIEVVERRLSKVGSHAKSGDRGARHELAVLHDVRAHLEEGEWIRTLDMPYDSLSLLSPLDLLTQKKMIYIANVGEADIGNPGESEYVQSLVTHASRLKAQVVPLCAQLESEIALLESDEQGDFLRELGLVEPALHRLVRTTYDLLGYRSFFTAGEKEVRAWTIVSGQTAVEAAAKIHSDIARGFIAAEVIPWKELVDFGGSWARAREQGRCRLEGKQYVVQDGDVVLFRHNQ